MSERVIPIAAIEVGQRLRALDPAWVDLLAKEIGGDGQRDAIRVVVRGEGFVLIDGARRIAALAKLGRDAILARVEPEEAFADAVSVRLGEIKGNMLRAGLTVLDRAYCIAAWREVYESAHPPQKRGPRPAAGISVRLSNNSSSPFTTRFTETARRALGLSERSVQRSLVIAKIEPSAGHRLTGHPCANDQSALLRLAGEPPERQVRIVDLLTAAQAETVAEAIDLLDGRTAQAPLTPPERLYQVFSRLPEREKVAFLDKHADQIEGWLDRREAEKKTKPRPALHIVR